MDFANDPVEFFDLSLDPGSNDFLIEKDIVQCVLSQVIESFEMGVADDIDYPEIYSKQRVALNSDELGDRYRVRDAERILALNPFIDQNSIDVELTDKNRLSLNFKLKSGQSVKNYLMR